ncbi:Uncharacterised protein [Legionella busanensis]|uniref:Uncharacterized protein n=1 Tax=Legionella busanensis TaxID=190655 RepID=A0A378JL13_9GAMM|nr:hypothetical protein [Legionella busanensis]STX52026.1 Uncharacterised protein [Legionella busanensis]
MNHLWKIICSFMIWFSVAAYADDEPTVVEDTQDFNMDMCIQNNKNECVNANCLTSTDIECIPKCEAKAQDKCKEQSLE